MPEDPAPAPRRKLSGDKPVYGSCPTREAPAVHSGWLRSSNPHVPPRLPDMEDVAQENPE